VQRIHAVPFSAINCFIRRRWRIFYKTRGGTMKLGELIADLCTYAASADQNIMEMEVLVHTVDQGDSMFPAVAYIVENAEKGTKAVHFDAPQTDAEEQAESA
jgi:hypothetical protein